jgi:hypothetical protein
MDTLGGYRLIGKLTIIEVGPSGKVELVGGKRKKYWSGNDQKARPGKTLTL